MCLEPSRSPTSGRTSPAVDYKDQPDDRIQQGKRKREHQNQGQRNRKTHFWTSASSDREQEEGCHTDPAVHRENEDQMKGVDSEIPSLNLVQQAKSLEETYNELWQHILNLLKYCRSQDEKYDSLREAHRQEAEKHCNVSIECDKLGRALGLRNRIIIKSKRRIKQLVRRNKDLVRENNQLVQEKDQLVQENNQLVRQKDQLVQENKHLVQENNRLVLKNNQLVRENFQLVQENNQLVQENNQQKSAHEVLYGSFLAQGWCIQKSQETAKLMEQKIERFESSAREKDEEIRQRGRCVEKLTKTIQEVNNLAQQQFKLNKQQQETNTSLTKSIRKTFELSESQQLSGSKQKTNPASVEWLGAMCATSQEQDTICSLHEPIRTSDDCLPVMPVPGFSAPASLPVTHQQQIPIQASSSGMVNFQRMPGSDADISCPISLPASVTSQDFGGPLLRVPSLQENQDVWRSGYSRY